MLPWNMFWNQQLPILGQRPARKTLWSKCARIAILRWAMVFQFFFCWSNWNPHELEPAKDHSNKWQVIPRNTSNAALAQVNASRLLRAQARAVIAEMRHQDNAEEWGPDPRLNFWAHETELKSSKGSANTDRPCSVRWPIPKKSHSFICWILVWNGSYSYLRFHNVACAVLAVILTQPTWLLLLRFDLESGSKNEG